MSDGATQHGAFYTGYEEYEEGPNDRLFMEVTVTEVTVSGKEALILLGPNTPAEQERHYYAVGDIVFVVQGDPFELVEEAFTLLP